MKTSGHIAGADLERLLSALGSGSYLMTSQHGGRRAGVTTAWVMACAQVPPLVGVSVRSGHWISPLVRDSRAFAVCALGEGTTLLKRKCAETSRPREGDPFDCVQVTRLATGSPVPVESRLVLDCEVVRHVDLEADHELYVGLVVMARLDGVTMGQPALHVEPKAPGVRGRV